MSPTSSLGVATRGVENDRKRSENAAGGVLKGLGVRIRYVENDNGPVSHNLSENAIRPVVARSQGLAILRHGRED
jgi:hypothetical protein